MIQRIKPYANETTKNSVSNLLLHQHNSVIHQIISYPLTLFDVLFHFRLLVVFKKNRKIKNKAMIVNNRLIHGL